MVSVLFWILAVLGCFYLVVGLAYAIYVVIKGTNSLVWFPLNVLFGPFAVVYIVWLTAKGRPLPL